MSEKYTIEEIHFQDNPDSTFFIWGNMSIEHGSFNSKEKAELVCRLLNEEEKRKSLPKIDTDMKEMIISFLFKKLKKNRRVFSTNKKELDDIEKLFFETINVIESLESE